jgi:hypothetical protein
MFGNGAVRVSPVSETAMACSRIRRFAKRMRLRNGRCALADGRRQRWPPAGGLAHGRSLRDE